MPLFPHDDLQLLPEPGRVLFIVNPGAGRGRADQLRRILGELAGSDSPHTIVETERQGHARDLARRAADEGQYQRIAAVGGDGTAMEVISGVIGARLPVVIVPTGTGNVLAVETNTPLDLPLACTLALSPAGLVYFDLGWSGGHYFAGRLGIGLEAETVRSAGHGAKRQFGRMGYLVHAVHAWRRRRLTRYAIAIDDHIITRRAHTIMLTNVANLGYSNLAISASCSPADGRLDLCLLRADSAVELLRVFGSIVTERTLEKGEWEVLPVYHGVEIRARPRQRVQIDGEPGGWTPTMAAVLPGIAPVVVPLPAEASAPAPGVELR